MGWTLLLLVPMLGVPFTVMGLLLGFTQYEERLAREAAQ